MAPSTALAKRPSPADTALMPPPPPPKRIKRPPKVIDEDTYTSALSHIIARDFFPGLLETESTQDYLDALDTGDDEWIDEAEKRVREILSTPRAGRRGVTMTPHTNGLATPRGGSWAGGTPMSTGNGSATPSRESAGDSATSQADAVNLNLSLSDFQRKYTSEDNESFNKVLDRQNTKHREKYRWLWNGNKIPSARQIAQAAHSQKLLTQSAANDKRDARFSTSGNDSASEAGTRLILRPSQDPDARPASISQIRPYEPRNTFMFQPESDISESHPHLTSTYQLSQEASHAPPKSVSYASTRLPTTSLLPSAEDNVPASPSLSAIDAAIAGHPRHRAFSTAAPSLASDAGDGGETPRVAGYKFVDAEPTSAELALQNAAQATSAAPSNAAETRSAKKVRDRNELLQHLLEINSSGGDGNRESATTGANLFSLQTKSRREDLHHRLVDKQLASKRAPLPGSISGSGSDRLAALRGDGAGKTGLATPKFLSSPVVSSRLGGLGDKTPTGRRARMEAGNLTPAAQSLYLKVGRTPGRGGGFDGRAGAGDADGERSARWTPKTLAGLRTRGP